MDECEQSLEFDSGWVNHSLISESEHKQSTKQASATCSAIKDQPLVCCCREPVREFEFSPGSFVVDVQLTWVERKSR